MAVVREVFGDAFAVAARLPRPALAHGVNCLGVMGAGFAKQVARTSPDLVAGYKAACEDKTLVPGGCWTYVSPRGGVVFNLASQDRLGARARLDWLEESVRVMAVHAVDLGVPEVALPRIGCGIGGLQWEAVRTLLETVDVPLVLTVVTPR